MSTRRASPALEAQRVLNIDRYSSLPMPAFFCLQVVFLFLITITPLDWLCVYPWTQASHTVSKVIC